MPKINRIDPKAWQILKEDEKAALMLKYTENKSSWEAGEILARSHYKYLEIQSRARRFLEIFTEHFEAYDEIIPPFVSGLKEIKYYFKLAIESRKSLKEIHEQLDNIFGTSGKKYRNRQIMDLLKKWREGDDHEQIVYNLVMEFDRWNNFRILPRPIQEPSAFKRRNKNVHKRHVRMTCQLPSISMEHLEEVYKPKSNQKIIYLPAITLENTRKIIKLKYTKEVIEFINKTQLYAFSDKKIAEKYLDAVAKYRMVEERTCKDGLEFWPTYRDLIQKSVNYLEVQQMVPSRKALVLALKDLTFY